MEVLVTEVSEARVGDVIVVAVHGEQYERGIDLVGKVELRVRVLASHSGETGETNVCMRPHRKLAILRA